MTTHSKWQIGIFFSGNPTNKTVIGTVYTWGLLLVANYLDQSLWSTNQKYRVAVRSNLLHSFLEVHNCVASFTIHGKLHEFGAEKPMETQSNNLGQNCWFLAHYYFMRTAGSLKIRNQPKIFFLKFFFKKGKHPRLVQISLYLLFYFILFLDRWLWFL